MSDWFPSADSRLDAQAQLFLFPHAGGSPLSYLSWAASLPRDMELRVVQLPGRPGRGSARPRSRIEPLVEELHEAFEAELDGRPYLFFGHSLGALLSYRLALSVVDGGGGGPVVLGVSGWAPELLSPFDTAVVHRLSDAELLSTVRQLGLVQVSTSREHQLLQEAVPSLRADFSLVADYQDDGAAVPCPIVAYTGKSDPLLPPQAMQAWSGRTPSFCGVRTFSGDHFYLFEHAAAIQLDLDRHLRRSPVVPP